MRVPAVVCAVLACAASVHAQYFSDGWKPGQPAAAPSQAAYAPDAPDAPGAAAPTQGPAAGTFDISKILTSGPVGSLLAKAGRNLSASLNASQRMAELWDPRVPLIHDDNYDELIVNEPLTPEEEARRTWFLVMCVPAAYLCVRGAH